MTARRLMLRSAAALLFILAVGGPASAATIGEVFLMLPDVECGGFSRAEREVMLKAAVDGKLTAGQSFTPDMMAPWVRTFYTNLLELHRPGFGPITYKLFEGRGFHLLAVCRGRQRTGPMDPACRFNLCFYRLDSGGLSRVEQEDFLPSISILDFITPEMLDDSRARADIAVLGPNYAQCLTCNASIHDSLAMDIITFTTVNASACNNFLPPFGLLPLTWNGLTFTKPHDRAAPREISY